MARQKRQKPLVIFDGACAFCVKWISYFKLISGRKLEFASYHDTYKSYPEISKKLFSKYLYLISPDGSVYRGAEAVFWIYSLSNTARIPLFLYQKLPGFGFLSERFYECVSRHRRFFGWLTSFCIGKEIKPLSYKGVSWIFYRILAVIYFIAFVSFGSQVLGLIGSSGILPVSPFLDQAYAKYGIASHLLIPTFAWFSSSNFILTLHWILGVAFSASLFLGRYVRVSLVALYALYLSYVSVGQTFMSYQWDVLLLEVGFLSILLSFSPLIIHLFRWLLFRLLFLSGIVKLLSNDPNWANFTALEYHFQTQPLPNPLSWYMHHLPELLLKAGVFGMFCVQLIVPFLLFLPRKLRYLAAIFVILLEGFIFLTGNYTFFNLLTISLCLFLLDDQIIDPVLKKLKRFKPTLSWKPLSLLASVTMGVLCLFLVVLSLYQGGRRMGMKQIPLLSDINRYASSYHVSNSYGLFAVMTTQRPEIVIEGSYDGKTWIPYVLPYKPGILKEMPQIAAPHQPRLDWQMWFAALNTYKRNPWFIRFMEKILEGSDDVLSLLRYNPFPDAPPTYVRSYMYEYAFTDPGEKGWWKRRRLGIYSPTMKLKDEPSAQPIPEEN